MLSQSFARIVKGWLAVVASPVISMREPSSMRWDGMLAPVWELVPKPKEPTRNQESMRLMLSA